MQVLGSFLLFAPSASSVCLGAIDFQSMSSILKWLWARLFDGTRSSKIQETPEACRTRTVKMLMGSCAYLEANQERCGCRQGSSTAQSNSNAETQECEDCRHPLRDHQGYAEFQDPEALQPLHPDVCPRSETVSKLAESLDWRRVIHVRGTPSSGKTTLAKLLNLEYCLRGERVLFITGWSNPGDPYTYLVKNCQDAGYTDFTRGNFLCHNIAIIIDEAQCTYYDTRLWLEVVKTISGAGTGPKICLFASYGSPSTGPTQYPTHTTPVQLGPLQRISLTKSLNAKAEICLFYDINEFDDAITRMCQNPFLNFDITADARGFLYTVTNGHPGATKSVIDLIFERFYAGLKSRKIQAITKDHAQMVLDDERQAFDFLKNTPINRSFPPPTEPRAIAVNVLHRVLCEKVMECDLNDPGVEMCYRMGWVHSDYTDTDSAQLVCFLPSRLHEKFIEFHFLATLTKPFPYMTYPTITSLSEKVLRHFSRKNLLLSKQGRASRMSLNHNPEAQYQDEWYRAFHSAMGHEVGMSSEWSCAGEGRIDFRVSEPAWGIELLRDGDRISEHCKRFLQHGQYHQSIIEGSLKDWIVIDFRHTVPKKCSVRGVKVWRVIFSYGYSSAYVLDSNNCIAVPEFPLID